MDKGPDLPLLFAMSQSEEKHTSPVSLAVDVVLVVAFFAFIFSVLKSHVPSNDPRMITFWAALATSCLTGVFWMALQMFRVVLKAQRRAGK
jgi:presenilin-like A22 family membrane protease